MYTAVIRLAVVYRYADTDAAGRVRACTYVTLPTVLLSEQIVVIMLAGYETSVTAARTALMLSPQYPEVLLLRYTLLLYALWLATSLLLHCKTVTTVQYSLHEEYQVHST
jgi:hypothetical protein